MKIVLLNGPPGCGKDTVVSHLVPYLNFTHCKFATPIKRMVCGLLNEDTRWLEENKDIKHRTLRLSDGAAIANIDTPRQLLISLSEDLLKKRYGSDFFGYVMINEIKKSANSLIIISDSGFASEAMPILRVFGPPNCLQIQLARAGCDFANDSRSYWEHKGLTRRLFVNNGSIHELTMSVLYAIMKHLGEQPLKEPDFFKG